MHLMTHLSALAVLTFSSTFAMADAPRLAAQRCAVNVHAPGNYYISDAPGLPSVLPGPTGTPHAAADINDCLTDIYAVQYGTKRGEVNFVLPGDATVAASVGCSRKYGVMRGGTRLCVAP